MTEVSEAIQTRAVSGISKFIARAAAYLAVVMPSEMKYDAALVMTISRRITKIQTSNCTWMALTWAVAAASWVALADASVTPCGRNSDAGIASRMNVISATPVTP